MLVRFANKFSALVAKYRKRDKFNHHWGKASSIKLTWSTLGRKYNRLNSLKLRLGSLVKKREDVCSDSGKSIFSILDSAGITIFLNHHRTNRRRYLLMQISCPAHRRVQRAFLLNAMISLKLIIVRVIKNTAYTIIVSKHSIGMAAILIGQKHWNHLFSNLSYLTATFLQYP